MVRLDQQNSWRTRLTEHFVFHFKKDSLAERNIRAIIRSQEQAFDKICDFLAVKPAWKTKYFLYPSRRLKKLMMGDSGNGNALPEKHEVHVLYNQKIKCTGPHELTHVLACLLGKPPRFLQEGLAEYFEKTWNGRKHDDLIMEYVNRKIFCPIVKLIDDKYFNRTKEDISYPEAGSFFKYLVKNFGRTKVLLIFEILTKGDDYEENLDKIRNIFKMSLSDLERKWLRQLQM